MRKDKQIEEMAKILASDCGDCSKCDCYHKEIDGTDACYFKYAEMIYNAGYRKASEVAREIFEEIEDLDIQLNNGDLDIKYFGYAIAELKKKYESEKDNGEV